MATVRFKVILKWFSSKCKSYVKVDLLLYRIVIMELKPAQIWMKKWKRYSLWVNLRDLTWLVLRQHQGKIRLTPWRRDVMMNEIIVVSITFFSTKLLFKNTKNNHYRIRNSNLIVEILKFWVLIYPYQIRYTKSFIRVSLHLAKSSGILLLVFIILTFCFVKYIKIKSDD